jgi:hypothetical protein
MFQILLVISSFVSLSYPVPDFNGNERKYFVTKRSGFKEAGAIAPAFVTMGQGHNLVNMPHQPLKILGTAADKGVPSTY